MIIIMKKSHVVFDVDVTLGIQEQLDDLQLSLGGHVDGTRVVLFCVNISDLIGWRGVKVFEVIEWLIDFTVF